MPQKFANAARGFLAAGISNSATTLTLSTGKGTLFPVANTDTGAVGGAADWFKLILDDNTNIEIVYVRTHTGGSDTFSNVLRAQEGTTALAFATGTTVGLRVTAGDMAVSLGREILFADRTYYVATTGSDSNDGLTVGTPFLTIQKAVNVVSSKLDISLFVVTIQVATGTYDAFTFAAPFGSGSVIVKGDNTTPANCLIQSSGACVLAAEAAPVARLIEGFKLVSTGYAGLVACRLASLQFKNINFGACAAYHMTASGGAVLTAYGDYSITGNATVHAFIEVAAIAILHLRTVTISGGVALNSGFAIARQGSMISAYGMIFSGSYTGARYEVQTNGVCFVNGASTLFFPGNGGSTVSTGGQYA